MKSSNSFEASEVDQLRAILAEPSLSGLTAEQQLAALNADTDATYWEPQPASQGDVQRYLMANTHNSVPIWLAILSAAGDSTHPANAAALMARELVAAKFDTLDMQSAGTGAMLDLLVSGGVMAAQHKTDLLALGNRKRSRAESVFGRKLRAAWIDAARAPA